MSHKHDPFLDYAMYSSIQSDREHGRPLGCGWIMLLMWGGIILYVICAIGAARGGFMNIQWLSLNLSAN